MNRSIDPVKIELRHIHPERCTKSTFCRNGSKNKKTSSHFLIDRILFFAHYLSRGRTLKVLQVSEFIVYLITLCTYFIRHISCLKFTPSHRVERSSTLLNIDQQCTILSMADQQQQLCQSAERILKLFLDESYQYPRKYPILP